MNFTTEELQELQKINSVTDAEVGKTPRTLQEIEIFNTTVQELWEQGFAVTKNNFLKLWLAFDSNPQVPITKPNILETVKVYRDHYEWKTPQQIEYDKLSAQLGQQNVDAIWSYFPGHRLESTYSNFNLIANFFLAHDWNIDRDSFTKAIGNIQAGSQGVSGSRDAASGRPGHRLEFETTSRPTVESHRVKQETDEKERANTPARQVTQEEKDSAISHVFSGGDGPGRSKPYKPTANTLPPREDSQTPTERSNIYWNGRIASLISSVDSNNLRVEVEQFSNRVSMPDIEKKFYAVEAFLNRRKTERAMAGRMG